MWQISNEKNWEALQKFEWVRDMKGVPQDPVYHAEGDVEIHTQMVLDALQRLPEYQNLTSQEQEILWAAALLHDVEKRSTTLLEENGRITSRGHAKKGAVTARQILYTEINTPHFIREEIFGLVKHHGLPLWAFEKQDPVKNLLKASLEVNTEWVTILAKADVLGRICQDQQDLLYRIELFAEWCKENSCWGKARVFGSPTGKLQYFRKEEQSPDFIPFETPGSHVVLLSGLAGVGKDYYKQQHYPLLPVISLDDLRRARKISHGDKTGNGQVIQEAKELAKKYLRDKTDFVWNATNISSQMREQLIDLFLTYDAHVEIIYLEVPFLQLVSQNKNREYPIPEKALLKMIQKLEVPKAWEAHEIKWIIKEAH